MRPIRKVLPYVAASLPVLLPCFWQSRIQAGDLGSHLYNAWLADLIHRGQAPGLAIVPQSTNVLFDLLLSALYGAFGADAAQRIAVSLAVLIFVWGTFAFASAASRRSWSLLPVIAALAYGWVFHMGFFNFYLAVGLCCWALALAWNLKPARLCGALPLLALAYLAQSLPVAWAIPVLLFHWAARSLGPKQRWQLAGTAIFALAIIHMALSVSMPTRWTWWQVRGLGAADQLWVFGDRFAMPVAALLIVWILLLIALLRQAGARNVFGGELFQIYLLTAAAIFLLPTWILIPGYHHPLVFISERMSLPLGVCLCVLYASIEAGRLVRYSVAAVAVLFFALLYTDERALNRFEDRIARAAAQIPPSQRVLCPVDTPGFRVNALMHAIDRVAAGRWYSYANYEPSTAAFRIRVTGHSPIVASTDADSSHMQDGTYIVKPRDLPLYRIADDGSGELRVQPLSAGATAGITHWNGL